MEEKALKGLIAVARREALVRGYVLTLNTAGRSMFPLLGSADKVRVVRAELEDLAIGDLILFISKCSSVFVVHRLVGRSREGEVDLLITKGDSVFHCDRPIVYDQVIGKVVEIRNPRYSIDLQRFWGRMLSRGAFFLSMTRVIAACAWLAKRIKGLIASSRSGGR